MLAIHAQSKLFHHFSFCVGIGSLLLLHRSLQLWEEIAFHSLKRSSTYYLPVNTVMRNTYRVGIFL